MIDTASAFGLVYGGTMLKNQRRDAPKGQRKLLDSLEQLLDDTGGEAVLKEFAKDAAALAVQFEAKRALVSIRDGASVVELKHFGA